MKLFVVILGLSIALVSAVPQQSGLQTSDEIADFIHTEEGSAKASEEDTNVFGKVISFVKHVGDQGKNKVHQLFENVRGTRDSFVDGSGNAQIFNFKVKDIFSRLKNFLMHNDNVEKFKSLFENLLPKSKAMASSILDILKENGKRGKDILVEFFNRYLIPQRWAPKAESVERPEREFSQRHEENSQRHRTPRAQDPRD